MIFRRKQYRFTGKNPPALLLEQHPNWEYALDEEDVAGQDETTLRPEDQRNVISDDTVLTAGTATLADGRTMPVLLEVSSGNIDGIWIYDPKGDWRISRQGQEDPWVPFVESWLPLAERSRTVSLSDTVYFPMRVASRLPLRGTDKPWFVVIRSDGRSDDAQMPSNISLERTREG